MLGKLVIKQVGKNVEVTFNDNEIDLHRLTGMNLVMDPNEGNLLTLTYKVTDIELDIDKAEVDKG